MQAYAEGFDLFDKCEYRARQREDRAPLGAGLGRALVAVRTGRARVRSRRQRPATTIEGYTEDSGEGRWTIEDATAHDVPTPVITASLYARLRSRGNGDYADRVLAALRNQFGGHAVKSRAAKAERSVSAPIEHAERREPARRRARAPAGRADDARDLRRHRRSGQAQTAARALQPRARGRAARALSPRRRLAQRESGRGLPRGVRAGDPPLLAAHARRGRAGRPARERQVRARGIRRGVRLRGARAGARRVRPGGRGTAQPRLLPVDRARTSSR